MASFKQGEKMEYDLIILGGGSAGIVAGVMAGSLGLRVLLIEKYRMGGECLNTGCVPSKALLHAAQVAHTLRTDASTVGLPVRELTRQDTRPALDWVRKSIDTVRGADATEKLLKDNGVTIRVGADARFVDAHTLEVRADGSAETITSDHFLLATGSHPAAPDDIPGLQGTPFLTNQTVFDLTEIPERLLVVGGGPIGIEMAQAFLRLGSRVTLLQKGERLLTRDDGELVAVLTERLRDEGVDIRLNTALERVDDGEAVIRRTDDGVATESIPFDRLLLAVGRAPNVDDLGLDRVGVEFGKEGVKVDDRLRTTVPNIYACGDVIDGGYRFSHIAEYQAKIAVRNIVFPGGSKTDYQAAPWATFTDPELAHVGLTEEEAHKQGIACDVYRQPFAQNDRAITEGASKPGDGLVKILVEPGAGGKVLGAQILGPRAGELLQEWIYAMEQGHSIRAIADMVHIYPTLSLASQHAAQRWYERQAQKPLVRGALDTYVQTIRPREKAIAAGLVGAALLGIAGVLLLSRSDQKHDAKKGTDTRG